MMKKQLRYKRLKWIRIWAVCIGSLVLISAPCLPQTYSVSNDQGNPDVKVWTNTDSKVYHCPGSQWYGKTSNGKYMTQKEAQDQGYRPAYNAVCQEGVAGLKATEPINLAIWIPVLVAIIAAIGGIVAAIAGKSQKSPEGKPMLTSIVVFAGSKNKLGKEGLNRKQ